MMEQDHLPSQSGILAHALIPLLPHPSSMPLPLRHSVQSCLVISDGNVHM